jgi:hypothetical protein
MDPKGGLNGKKPRNEAEEPEEEEELKMNDLPQGKEREDVEEPEEYEFLIPLNNMNRMKTFVDRYFLRFYKHLISPETEENLSQYAFLHTNKWISIQKIIT